ncbi:MAG: DUF302 domain-containing protein [Gammaproteobacteria bacterium]|nr:DUF302 domain-containing protein [Gammaproteobacteria bacterium]
MSSLYRFAALLWFSLFAQICFADDPEVIVIPSPVDYLTTFDSLESAIVNQGLEITKVMNISAMLSRTAADLGMTRTVYHQAESLEFCSATLSHIMTQADPANLTVCPFTIALYTTADQPDQVYVAYHRPLLLGSGQPLKNARSAIDKLFTTLVSEIQP